MKWIKEAYPDPKIGDTRKRYKFCWLPFTFVKPFYMNGYRIQTTTYWLQWVTIWERYSSNSQLQEQSWEITDVADHRAT